MRVPQLEELRRLFFEIETDTIVSQLAPTRSAFLNPLLSAALQGTLVQLGTAPKFYFNNVRDPRPAPGAASARPGWHAFAAVALFLVALGLWALCQAAVIDHIGPLDAYTGTDYEEAVALVVLSAVQALYPLVAVMEVVWMRAMGDYYAHNEMSAHLSTVKVRP